MLDVGFSGIDTREVTMKLGNGIMNNKITGIPVKISADKTVDVCADRDQFFGKLTVIDTDGFGSVQRKGFCEFNYSGAVSCGFIKIVADGNGGVKEHNSGQEYNVVSVDTVNNTLILDL